MLNQQNTLITSDPQLEIALCSNSTLDIYIHEIFGDSKNIFHIINLFCFFQSRLQEMIEQLKEDLGITDS